MRGELNGIWVMQRDGKPGWYVTKVNDDCIELHRPDGAEIQLAWRPLHDFMRTRQDRIRDHIKSHGDIDVAANDDPPTPPDAA